MSVAHQESSHAVFHRFTQAISNVDPATLGEICSEDVQLAVPGARDVDLTSEVRGAAALCHWAEEVNRQCGATTFALHRCFENGCELMSIGEIRIERHPRTFVSPCALHIRLEGGRIASFRLLLDTYALEKFRGEMD